MKIEAADLFCGAGGTSTGLEFAVKEMGKELNLLAVNHWPTAVKTHSFNHPNAKHMCVNLDNVDPIKAIPGAKLDILIASPECKHHSVARGGRPMNDQSRASAWIILRWAEAIRIERILIENVKEFRDWGPIGVNGRPLKSKKGHTYRAFLEALRSLGYRVEDRVLNCADFGDPTTRERLFIMARRGTRKIKWPERTHSPKGEDALFGSTKPWRAAREIINWEKKGTSIFRRKRPLAPSTIERIVAGLKKFGGKDAEPFLVILRNNATVRSIDKPIPTITAGGGHFGICQSFIVPFFGERQGQEPRCHDIDSPLPTVTGHGAGGLVTPFITGVGGPQGSAKPRSVEDPLKTILKENHFGVVMPFIMGLGGPKVDTKSVEDPLRTILTRNHFAVVEPFIASVNHGKKKDDEDMSRRTKSVKDPMPAITTKNGWALVEPFIVEYYGTLNMRGVDKPLPTITTKDRFALVEPAGKMEGRRFYVDILFRMLEPQELAQAMSFPKEYEFSGGKVAAVKQIGNAVPVMTAQALCRALLAS